MDKKPDRIDRIGDFLQSSSKVAFFLQLAFLVLALLCKGWPILIVLSPLLIWCSIWAVIVIAVALIPNKAKEENK